jgi:hypothetical protein
MSDTHIDNDKTAHVDFDDILEGVISNVILSSIIPFGFIPAIYKALRTKQKSKPTPTENLIEVIKTGKEQGLSKLEVEMKRSTAGKIDFAVFEVIEGINFNIEAKDENHMIIKAKYK